ncbi:MAG: c-type cytochrome domain-containing protein [Bdellovibrionales bacterium]
MKILAVCALFGFVACSSRHDSFERVAKPSQLVIAEKVEAVLRRDCASCHGPVSPGYGGIDYITNIEALTSKGLVVPGNPDQSRLYQVIFSNEMPTSQPLSTGDKQLIYDWIFLLGQNVGAGVSFARIQAEVLQPYCLSCHRLERGTQGDIDLSTYEAVLKTVIPTSPQASLLYDSVNQGRMPKGGQPLPLELQLLIYEWILLGAQN